MANGAEARQAFARLLVNTFVANLTTSFLWFAVTFWIYLETRSVLATSLMGGSYMLLLAVVGVPFGMLVDRHRKKSVMVWSQAVTAVAFGLALVVFLLAPRSQLLTVGSLPFWLFLGAVLIGGVVESARHITLATTVTLLIPAEERDRANGRVGVVNGLSFAVTSVFSGLAIGWLGMYWTLVIAVVLSVLSLVHLLTIGIPERGVAHVEGVPQPVDFGAAWRTIIAVPGLIALIAFTTFNNLLGGVYMALLDPYGLSLVSVEAWGLLYGVISFAFIIGGAIVAARGLGRRPLRVMLLANLAGYVVGMVFTLRESVPLLAAGMLVYMALVPLIESAEQTVLQRVVPYDKQGRVFGFAQAVEVGAAPITAFLIGPIAEFGLIPYMESGSGQQDFGWLLGDGDARGIALVFVASALVGLVATALALVSRSYHTLSRAYDEASPSPTGGAAGAAAEPSAA